MKTFSSHTMPEREKINCGSATKSGDCCLPVVSQQLIRKSEFFAGIEAKLLNFEEH
jgi:hypothetical protein